MLRWDPTNGTVLAGFACFSGCIHTFSKITPLSDILLQGMPKKTIPNLRSSDDGGEHESSLRLARLDLRNQARRLPGAYGFRLCRQPSPLVAKRPSIGREIPGYRQGHRTLVRKAESLRPEHWKFGLGHVWRVLWQQSSSISRRPLSLWEEFRRGHLG